MEYIPPLITRVQEYSIHAQVQIKGHREYSFLEVMSYENEDGRMFIHVILTLHDGSSVRYINDHTTIEMIKLEAPARQIYYAAIEYDENTGHSSRNLDIRFFTHKNEEIIANLSASMVAYKSKIPMHKPSGFVRHHEMPIGLSFFNHKMNYHTKIKINNRDYKIQPSRELFGVSFGDFGRMTDSYTRVNTMILQERVQIKHTPESLVVGESWGFSAGKRCINFTITELSGDQILVTRGTETHKILVNEGKLYLSKITNDKSQDNIITVDFVPALAVAPHNIKQTCRMTVTCNDDIVYEATVYTTYDAESNSYNFVGDKTYPANGDNIHYIVRSSEGWVFTNPVI